MISYFWHSLCCSIQVLIPGFYVTAYNLDGIESGYADEISVWTSGMIRVFLPFARR